MNVGQAAHLSGQMSGQAAQMNQVANSGVGVGGADGLQQHHQQIPDMSSLTGTDQQFVMMRTAMCDKIFDYIGRKQSSAEWRKRLPELAKRLEEILYGKFSNKNDYYSMMKGPVEPQLQFAIKTLSAQNQHNQQNPQMSRQIASSSGYGKMIPTPGMSQGSSGNSRMAYGTDNSTLSSSGVGMVPQNANMGTSIPGSLSNGYQHLNNSIPQNSSQNSVQSTMGSVGVQRQLPHMIPTPGFSNQQNVPANPDYSNGTGYFNGESAVAPHMQHQKQFPINQNSNQMQHIGGHSNSGIHSSMLDNSSGYGLSDGHMNGGIGLHGSNMQLTNRTTAPETYMNNSTATIQSASSAPETYGSSPKPLQQPLQQQFNQHPQQRIQSSVDMAGSSSFYATGSTPLTTASSQSMNVANLQSRSRMNPMLATNQLNIQSIQPQPQVKTEVLDQPDKLNFQSSQLAHDQLMRQHSMPQHQVQPNSQFVQNQYHINQQQPNLQHQQAMLRTNSFKQSQMASGHSMQMSEQGTLPHTELVPSQASDPVDLPSFQGQFQQRNAIDNVKGGQMFGRLSGSQNFHSSASHGSQQLLPSNPQLGDGSNDVSYVLKGSQTEQMLQPQWQPQTMEKAAVTTNSSLEKQIQEDFCQRTMAQDGAQQPFSSDWRLSHCTVTSIDPAVSKPQGGGFEQVTGNIHYLRQIRWLLLLFHAKSCTYPVGSCKFHGCVQVQELLKHFQNCQRKDCSYRSCSRSKMVSHHYKTCVDEQCPVCSVVRKFLRQSTEQASKQKALESRKPAQQNATQRIMNGVEGDRMDVDPVPAEVFDDQPSVPKRLKLQPPSPSAPENDISVTPNPHVNPGFALQETQPEQLEHSNMAPYLKREVDVKADMRAPQKPIKVSYGIDGNATTRHNVIPGVPNEMNSHIKQENMSIDKETSETALEVKNETNDPTDATVSKSGKPKIKGVSLTELFTPEQIREHIDSLRLWVGQSKAKAEKNQAIGHSENENSCQLCRVEKLTFEPPPIYCSPCGARIKRNAPYYTVGTGDTRHYFCIPCYNESRGETIEVEGQAFLKAKLEKKRNDEETEEWWVQCDKCECWQHQICALFNGRRNDGGQAEYTCPNCYVEEVKCGLRKPLPQSAVLGAKDLPRTVLSDHIEDRLFKRLKQEKQDRAAAAGKNIDEIPGAEGLVVRVVSSVDKKLEVKPRFLEIFSEDNYPQEFPYKSKAVLLFQKIEGVEVCLFGMYVQEFGVECSFPNQRRVYLSYLDSVKYFRPEIRTVTGEALRTFVYHEILIGYLEYCKLRGFTSCYIWACPPLKGEDYILYCHPEIQKTPKSDKLREWYLSMLRKASKEEIVVELTNLYDHFFNNNMGECKAKVTAARLPYFDGDYWPGAAEDMINQLRQEEDDRKLQKKSKTKKIMTKRALKAAGHTDLSGNASKDAMLMQKLGETIHPMKEDFIMVHLQYSCSHCCILMVSGRRWVCHQCRSFYICDKCYDAEQQLEDRERHPSNSRDTHMLHPVPIEGVPKDTKDRDDILESEFFDTRQAFLSLCQGNHYQYDTLRRAKHSSMMVLYHLHNPTAPAFVTTCNVCCHDIETGQGWRCEVCPDFDVCNACFQKGAVNHPHKLTNHPSAADRDAQNAEARQMRVQQLRKMLDLLVHASTCRSGSCQYPNCRKVKGLFRHGMQCKTRASGGCVLCKKMWYMLQLHARACKDSDCNVPRCRDLKEHLRRLQQQSDSRRRAAVNEMMRQRAAEVAANE